MSDLSSSDWSEIDANNTAPSPNGWPSGTYPNQVEPIGRSTMGGLKRSWTRINGIVTTTGSANAYVYTPTNTSYPASYVNGEIYTFKANFTNTGAATININSLGAKSIYKQTDSGPAALTGGEIVSGQYYQIAYNGTQMLILNKADVPAQTITLSGDVTGSGTTAITTALNASGVTLPDGSTATTQSASDASTKVATTAYVDRGASGASDVLLQTQTASSSASVAFTSIPSGYDKYYVEYTNVSLATAGANLGTDFSTDNGSNYITGSYNYGYSLTRSNGTASNSGTSSATHFYSGVDGVNSGAAIGGRIDFSNLTSATGYKTVTSRAAYINQAAGLTVNESVGGLETTTTGAAVNAIRFIASSGNIASGTFSLYAKRKS